MLAALLSRRPEAIIMVGSPGDRRTAPRLLRRAGIPVVETWELPAAPIDAVAGFDNYEAGVAVARHLVAQGRQRLAFIGGDDPRATRRWNRISATTALAAGRASAAPADPGPQRLGQRRPRWRACPASMRCSRPTTRMPSASCPACEMPDCCETARPGQPVAVIGLGDLEMGRLIAPRLSTIRVHGDAIGRTAAKLMLTRDGPRRVDLGFELVLRDSG